MLIVEGYRPVPLAARWTLLVESLEPKFIVWGLSATGHVRPILIPSEGQKTANLFAEPLNIFFA